MAKSRTAGVCHPQSSIFDPHCHRRTGLRVRNRDDAELLIGGLRPTEDVERARQAVNYLAERVKEHTVRLPLPMRRLLAIK